MPPLSISTAAYDGYDLVVALDAIASLGARFAEIAYIRGYIDFDEHAFGHANAATVANALAQAGLASVAVSAHLDAALPDTVEPLKARMRFARRIGAGIVITNAGPRARRDTFLRNLDRLVPEAEALDVVLAFENPGHGSGDLFGTGEEGAELVRVAGSAHVRLNYDIGNAFTYSGERLRPQDDIAAALPHAAHLHAKDVLATCEGWSFAAVGEGSVDYDAVLAALRDCDLPIGTELPLRLSRPGRRDPIRATEPLPLAAINDAVRRSLSFLTDRLASS